MRVRLDANGSPKKYKGGKKNQKLPIMKPQKIVAPKNILTFPNLTLQLLKPKTRIFLLVLTFDNILIILTVW